MPSSYPSQIPIVIDILLRLKPESILDIGVGFGKYGFLSREYLEIWGGNGSYGHFKLRIDGVEAFNKYINPCHDYIYDNIYTMDAIEFSKRQDFRYDLVLLIDVIEHFEKEKGIELLKSLLNYNKNVLVVTPKRFHPQNSVFNNPYEIHRSLWTKGELLKFGKGIYIPFPVSHVVLIGEDYLKLKRYALRKKILNFLPGFLEKMLL